MIYKGRALEEISFPLGGIGTGSIGLAGNGRLIDWEIFNKPKKGSYNGFTFIAVSLEINGKRISRILQGDLTNGLVGTFNGKPCAGGSGYGFGPLTQSMAGFPHFRGCEFDGRFPIAEITFTDEDFPGRILLTAFNPLIPLREDDSSIPAAYFEVKYFNETDSEVKLDTVFVLSNPFERSENVLSKKDGTTVNLLYPECDRGAFEYGEMSLSCPDANIVQPYLFRGGWKDKMVMFWNEFTSGNFLFRTYDQPASGDGCLLGKRASVMPRESTVTRFVASWYCPNNCRWWTGNEETKSKLWKNYYATLWSSSEEVAKYALSKWDEHYEKTALYRDTLYDSTLDEAVIDAVASTVSVLKSPTVFRLENGEFYGFEGVEQNIGSCEGTCTHVYNYAYAMCFLFPSLERTVRNIELDIMTGPNGSMPWRLVLPLSRTRFGNTAFPCLDGQMGSIIKTYREWMISGDNEWLKAKYPWVKSQLEFTWSEENKHEWDRNKDGVLEGMQHNTLDMQLFGPSSWLQSLYLGALSAGIKMATFMGDTAAAEEYAKLYENGRKYMKERLFNGEYFFHEIDVTDKSIPEHFGVTERYWSEETGEIKYQIAGGCEIDQMLGQWHSAIIGLGDLFDKDQLHTALKNLYKNNYKTSMREHANPWRLFSVNDEAGTLMCSYPEGSGKPKIPITYCEETMHGFEYAFAGLLISEGFVDEGLSVVRAVRDKYRGYNRNPYNELECGSNYARSMASFALLPIFSGFKFDLPHGRIGFDPVVNKSDFKCLWSLGTGWGQVRIKENRTEIEILDGSLKLSEIALPYLDTVNELSVDGVVIPFKFEGGRLFFEEINAEKSITVS